MKKKLFTLLTLMLCVCSGAWAETYDNEALTVTWANPSTITEGTAEPTAAVLSCPWAGTSSGTSSYDNITYTLANSEQTFSFTITPFPGLTFTPGSVEFDMVKFGSDNCFATINIVYGDADATSTQLADLKDKTDICRNKENVNADKRHQTYTLDATKAGAGAVTLKITLKPASGKTMGVANVVIKGTVSGTTQTVTSYTITTETSDETLGAVSGGGSFVENNTATLTATAKEGGAFVKWQKDGADFEGNTASTINVTATADATYTAIFKKLFTVTYNLEGYGLTTTKLLNNFKAGSFNEKYADADGKYTIPSYSHYYMYREGYVFSKWEDQDGNQYDKGTEITISKDVTLTPVWNETTQTLWTSKAEGTVTWNLRFSTILFSAWQGTNQVGYYTKPFTVNGEIIAVPMVIDATNGKIDNSGRSDKDNAQVNQGTKFTIPAVKGMKVVIANANTAFSTTTVAGATDYEKSNSDKTLTYTYNGDEETIDIVINENNQYLKTIVVTYPAAVVTKTIGSTGYATFCADVPVSFEGSGVTAYIATLSGSKVSFSEVTSVPANTGVLLKGTAGEKTFTVAESTTDVSANKFVGVTEDSEVGGGIFVLMAGTADNQGTGFYKTTAEKFTVGANTAYLPASVAEARTFIGFDNESTGINEVPVSENAQDKVYNLQGVRVAQPTKGLYIVNGKKIIVK